MKKIKLIVFASLLAFSMMGLQTLSSTCGATATNCNASCRITAPPGGSVQCTGTANQATCIAYNAAGAQCRLTSCQCAGHCFAMIPTC